MIFSQKHWTPATISTSNNISTCHSQGAMSLTVIISQHATHRALKWYFHRNIEHQQLYPPVIITFNMPLCTPLIETSHKSQHYVRYKVIGHGAPERKSVGMQDGWNAQMHTVVNWAWVLVIQPNVTTRYQLGRGSSSSWAGILALVAAGRSW